MFFQNYKKHPEAKIRNSLFWEYDLDRFDWYSMRNVVVQRIIEENYASAAASAQPKAVI